MSVLPRPLIIERPNRTLVVDRAAPRGFVVERKAAREIVIERSGLPGKDGVDGVAGLPSTLSGGFF